MSIKYIPITREWLEQSERRHTRRLMVHAVLMFFVGLAGGVWIQVVLR